MRIAIIPARGGSKRIPRKNVRTFVDKPVLAWSILAAKLTGLFDHIIVSTDDPEIAEVSRKWGAEVPFVRVAELSGDFVGTSEVVADAVSWAIRQGWPVTEICCIYATAPFIQAAEIKSGLTVLTSGPWSYVFSACRFKSTVWRGLRASADGSLDMLFPDLFESRSQDLPDVLFDAAQFYWGTREAWITGKRIFASHSTTMVLPNWRVQDLDSEDDWIEAELRFEILRTQGRLL